MAITYRGQTFSGYNKPKAQVSGGKSHVVLAKKGDKVKLVRFGQAGKVVLKELKETKRFMQGITAVQRKINLLQDIGLANINGRKEWQKNKNQSGINQDQKV